jgi:hypothetical protein
MLRSVLALLSNLQIGVRIKRSIERLLRQAVIVAVAVVILITAAAFGLLAAYHTLVRPLRRPRSSPWRSQDLASWSLPLCRSLRADQDGERKARWSRPART